MGLKPIFAKLKLAKPLSGAVGIIAVIGVSVGLALADTENLPIPQPAPERPSQAEVVTEQSKGTQAEQEAEMAAPLPMDKDTSQCEAALAALNVTYTIDKPVTGDTGCGVMKPFNVSEIAPGVTVEPGTQLRCNTALALAKWIQRIVLPATDALAKQSVTLTSIRHGSTYVCRRRNNLPTGKLSEHAIGNAIDIVAFEFDGHPSIAIEPREKTGRIEEAFQRTVRAGACLDFTTVLGPGSDGFHSDHLHLDIAKRRGGYRLCR